MAKNQKKSKETHQKFKLSSQTKRTIFGIFLFLISAVIILSFFNKAGIGGKIIFKKILITLLGNTAFLVPLFLIILGWAIFQPEYWKFKNSLILAISFLVFGISGLLETLEPEKLKGGYLGLILAFPFLKLFSILVGQIIFGVLILAGFLIAFQIFRKSIPSAPVLKEETKKPLITRIFKKIVEPKLKVKEIEKLPKFETIKEAVDFKAKSILEKETPSFPYQPPPLDLLDQDQELPHSGDIRNNSAIIKKTLENFGISVQMGEINIGPTVTQYTLKPAEGIKLSKITSLSNNLSLALASHPIRIEAPIPGKSLVGIEVPNKVRAKVRLRNLIEDPNFLGAASNLTINLGRDVSGSPVFADLGRMPHLLVAGSTGTGKTCAADTLMFTERGLLTFEELHPLLLNSEADFKIKIVSRDGIETTKKIYNNGICQFYKLSTSRGYQIEVTAEHPLWVLNRDGSCGWKPASLIREGDYVAISRGPSIFGNKVDFSDFKPSKIKAYHRKISFPQKMTPQLAQFLGLLTADGGLSVEKKGTHRVVYTQANPHLLSLYKKLLKELFGIIQFIEKRSGSNPNNKAKDIVVNSKHLKEFLTYLGMDSVKSPQKVIPRAIREAPKEIVFSYLKVLFDNDGYVGEKTPIELSLSSKKLLSQVQIMLLNFGIVSSLKVKKEKNYPENQYFRLSIYGEDARKFIKKIGFLRNEKYQKVKKLLKLSSNPNLDVIPNLSDLLRTLVKKYRDRFASLTNKGWQYQLGVLIPKYAFSSLTSYNSGERRPSYQALKKILDFYQPISQELEYQELEKISKRNFYWDRVEKISRTSGVGYDFFVPGSDSFVGNGFVNHNTIFLNGLILSLIYRNSPKILRFILVDPKRVEFPVYNDLPHLLAPVILDVNRTVSVLQWLTKEMERRFEVLAELKVRDIAGFNELAFKTESEPLPYIILIIDELADLIAAKGKEVEAGIVRLAQLARAVGIHLVVATQRPSVEVITGLIKANITSRVTFQVASQVDSRTVLDSAGAEKLLGLGDMLFISAETLKPKRIQGAYVSLKEVRRVVKWLRSKVPSEIVGDKLAQDLKENLIRLPEEKTEFFETEEDPLYEEAKRIVIEARKASASLLQRRLKIGYARAARLIDVLEERGVVGPLNGAKPREVYIVEEEKKDEDWQKI